MDKSYSTVGILNEQSWRKRDKMSPYCCFENEVESMIESGINRLTGGGPSKSLRDCCYSNSQTISDTGLALNKVPYLPLVSLNSII
jgi:hypothetical protein